MAQNIIQYKLLISCPSDIKEILLEMLLSSLTNSIRMF